MLTFAGQEQLGLQRIRPRRRPQPHLLQRARRSFWRCLNSLLETRAPYHAKTFLSLSDKKPSVLASFLNAVTEDGGANASGEDHYTIKDVLNSIQKNETKCEWNHPAFPPFGIV